MVLDRCNFQIEEYNQIGLRYIVYIHDKEKQSYISIKPKKFFYKEYASTNYDRSVISPPTEEEIAWLTACIEAKKYIPMSKLKSLIEMEEIWF